MSMQRFFQLSLEDSSPVIFPGGKCNILNQLDLLRDVFLLEMIRKVRTMEDTIALLKPLSSLKHRGSFILESLLIMGPSPYYAPGSLRCFGTSSLPPLKHPDNLFPNFFGLNSIHHRVKGRWKEKIDIGQKNVNMERHMATKTMGEKGEESWCIRDQDDTDMGATCPQGFGPSLVGGEAKDSSCNEDVRKTNAEQVNPNDQQRCCQPVHTVRPRVSTG